MSDAHEERSAGAEQASGGSAFDSEFLNDLEQKIARSVADALGAGAAEEPGVRERVAREVAAAVAVAAQTGARLDDVLRAATHGAVRAAREAGDESGLGAAVEGLGAGVERAALGAKLAFEESVSGGAETLDGEWRTLLGDLRGLGERFVDIVGRSAARTGDEVAGGIGDLARHAERAREDFEPRLRQTLDACQSAAVGASSKIGRRAAATVFGALGDAMTKVGRRLRE